MRLLVYEHVSGGGFAGEAISVSVLSEGFGMLRTLISDFKAAGHCVTTMVDSRIARLNPPIEADYVVPISSSRKTQAQLCELAEQTDAAYLIAPETDGILQSLVELVEQSGTISLNCLAGAIKKVSDKTAFYKIMKKNKVLIPETKQFSVVDDLKEIKHAVRNSLKFPVVFKPSDGVSCDGVSAVNSEEQIASAVGKIRKESASKHFLVQELISGAAASVSLLTTGSNAAPVILNSQDVTLETPEARSNYRGGMVPFGNPLKTEAFTVAEKIVKSITGLRGYVGIDFVLIDESAVAIEVNPRLTTSYVGLRDVVNFNPAQAIINAVLKGELPAHIQSYGCTYFSKVETAKPTVAALEKTYSMDEVVSPPFPVVENGGASMLMASHGVTCKDAMLRFREAKKRVLDTINRGKQMW